MSDVGADLSTLKTLHSTFVEKAQSALDTRAAIDSAVDSAQWKGNYANQFKGSWQQYSQNLANLSNALTEAAHDVKANHNNIAAATGMPDRI
jgi:uncharacterized protein YukE